MKVVLDTNVLISSTLWEGSVAQKLLLKLIESDAEIYSSGSIISEYCKVLKEDLDFPGEEVEKLLEKVHSFVTLVIPEKKLDIVKEDPNDNKIIECAVESASEYIITYDKHLLKLKECEGIKTIKPEEAINIF